MGSKVGKRICGENQPTKGEYKKVRDVDPEVGARPASGPAPAPKPKPAPTGAAVAPPTPEPGPIEQKLLSFEIKCHAARFWSFLRVDVYIH